MCAECWEGDRVEKSVKIREEARRRRASNLQEQMFVSLTFSFLHSSQATLSISFVN